MLKQLGIFVCILPLFYVKVAVLASEECDNVKQGQKMNWKGYEWIVVNAARAEPGPNRWDPSNVWVDSDDRLHLHVRQTANGWSCAELYSTSPFSFGSYRWYVEGAVDKLDRHVVFGLFTYGTLSGTNEIDIEIARWSEPAPEARNLFYTIYPRELNPVVKNVSDGILMENLGGTYTTHRFEWYTDHVSLRSQNGHQPERTGNEIFAWDTPQSFAPYMPIDSVPLHMNLWLHNGAPPTDGREVELIIHSFEYIPN